MYVHVYCKQIYLYTFILQHHRLCTYMYTANKYTCTHLSYNTIDYVRTHTHLSYNTIDYVRTCTHLSYNTIDYVRTTYMYTSKQIVVKRNFVNVFLLHKVVYRTVKRVQDGQKSTGRSKGMGQCFNRYVTNRVTH